MLMEGRGRIRDVIKYISTVASLMRAGLSRSDQLKFDRLQEEVLGDLHKYDKREIRFLFRTFGELFRYGEHVLDERFENYVMSDAFGTLKIKSSLWKSEVNTNIWRCHFKDSVTNPKGERIDLRRLRVVAALQEARLWKKFTKLREFRSRCIESLSPDHLEFFRLCVRGASRYFINTAAR